MKEVRGHYYDGTSSRVYNVAFSVRDGWCHIDGEGIRKRLRAEEISVSEQLDRAHRILRFSDGSSCELPENGHLAEMLKGSNLSDTFTNRLQRSWRWVALSLLLLVIVFFSGYKWGVPYAADKLSYRLPYNVLAAISRQALSTIDDHVLKPSQLSAERQAQLRARFSSVTFPHVQKFPMKVEFRDGAALGANAFALPDGTIVFFDKLVQLAGSDDELVAVYAHEAGHVAHRHGVRQLIQSSIVSIALAAYLGDVSTLGGAFAGFVLEAKYSRDFERDADRYAAAVLKNNNLSPKLLGTFLKKLEAAHGKHSGDEARDKTLDYISSHPSTDERMREIEQNSTR